MFGGLVILRAIIVLMYSCLQISRFLQMLARSRTTLAERSGQRRHQAPVPPTLLVARRLLVQTCGELRALAVGEAADCLAGRDAAAVEDLCGFDLPDLGEREQDLEDFRGL